MTNETTAESSKAAWLRRESHHDSEHFQPTAEDREHLLGFLDAWGKAMAEQEKLMGRIDSLIATGNPEVIMAAARWLGDAPHAGRLYLIREWKKLNDAQQLNPDPEPNF